MHKNLTISNKAVIIIQGGKNMNVLDGVLDLNPDNVLDELEKMERIKNSLGGKIAVIMVCIGGVGMILSVFGTIIFPYLKELMFTAGFISIVIVGAALFYLVVAYLILIKKKDKITIVART